MWYLQSAGWNEVIPTWFDLAVEIKPFCKIAPYVKEKVCLLAKYYLEVLWTGVIWNDSLVTVFADFYNCMC